MLLQPGLNLGMFVSTVIVHHQMQRYIAGKLLIQTSQKYQKLPIAMPGKALTDHFALGHFQSGKQRRSTIAFVKMRNRSAAAFFYASSEGLVGDS